LDKLDTAPAASPVPTATPAASHSSRLPDTPVDPWRIVRHGTHPADFAQDESLFALANGALGVRGGLEEAPGGSHGSFLAGAWERTPIEYHERFPGFAAHTDTRIPVADAIGIHLRLGDIPVRLAEGEWLGFSRELDLRQGCYRRMLRWRSPAGETIEIHAERLVPLDHPGLMAIRYRVESVDYNGAITLESSIDTARDAIEQGADPRIGVRVDGGFHTEQSDADEARAWLVQRTSHSGVRVACVQKHRLDRQLHCRYGGQAANGVAQIHEGELAPGTSVTLEKIVAYAWSEPHAEDSADALLARAEGALEHALAQGFDGLLALQQRALAPLWERADLAIEGDPRVEQSLRFNLFHVFQSSGRDGHSSAAAKGLTGEGYEGHYFWDAEAFMLPALVNAAPELARGMLVYRYRTLDRARAHAREMNHERGALYAWRTISGDECSAYFPSGSAQYHINAAVAWAVRLYVDASGDHDFLREQGAEMLVETARVWLDIGHFNPRRGGAFCIHSVTGPDEYSALVDNNHYTNRMAQQHLRDAAATARWLADAYPQDWAALAARLALHEDEIDRWQRAADAMYLPVDAALGVFPQDDAFLDKPRLCQRTRAHGKRPLLLEMHPLTIYRHQVCKQADTLLALVLAGNDVDRQTKRRNFDYYEGVTVHDSTLSASTFAVLAAEVGRHDKAYAYFLDTLRVDLDDLHGNAAHGVHMAAMAGSWLALTWGFGGLRVVDGLPSLAPTLPARWTRYRFGLRWHNAQLRVEVSRETVRYSLGGTAPLQFRHHGSVHTLAPGGQLDLPLHPARLPRPLKAVIFDLDGVIADTAVVHHAAWKQLAAEIAVPFDDATGERMKGVDRRGSLDILLERAERGYSEEEKHALAERKNAYYRDQIAQFGPQHLLPGARDAIASTRAAGLKIALASASRNAPMLLERLGIAELFDYVVDAGRIARSKPDPAIFLDAARGVGVAPHECLGVEDAEAGVDSILAAGMTAVAVGDSPALAHADVQLPNVAAFDIAQYTT
jgi:alpha,alpha-trehalose phosphorylase